MRSAKHRWLVLPFAAAFLACSGSDGPLELPVLPPTDPRLPFTLPETATIELVSGNDQEGKAGEQLGEAFVVRVTDGVTDVIENVPVTWSITSGAGLWRLDESGEPVTTETTRTDSDGLARAFFQPTSLGTSTASASVAGVEGSPVTFTSEATALVIQVGWYWGWGFWGPDRSQEVTVPVGTTVEWVNVWGEHSITSSSVPPGGTSFDAVVSNQGDRFQFVPDVAGTWEYYCQIHGGEEFGTIMVQEVGAGARTGEWDY